MGVAASMFALSFWSAVSAAGASQPEPTVGAVPRFEPAPMVARVRFEAGDPLDEMTRDTLERRQRTLSSLWVFASLNYLYCDVVSLMDAGMLEQYASGTVEGMTLNETFLMGATLYMQVPLSMVVLSTALNPRASRVANIAAGATTTLVQGASLFVGKPSKYYLASSIIEMATTSFITVYAWRGLDPKRVQPVVSAAPGGGQVGVNVRF